MNRRALALLLPLMLAIAGASAPASAEDAKKADVGQFVDLQTVGLPIVSGRTVVNYVFVRVRIVLTSSADVAKLREKEAFFRDALVRAGHRTPFTRPDDLNKIDEVRLAAVMKREAAAIAGPGQIQAVTINSQAPRRNVHRPRPTA